MTVFGDRLSTNPEAPPAAMSRLLSREDRASINASDRPTDRLSDLQSILLEAALNT